MTELPLYTCFMLTLLIAYFHQLSPSKELVLYKKSSVGPSKHLQHNLLKNTKQVRRARYKTFVSQFFEKFSKQPILKPSWYHSYG